jgi:hypothetical protein
MVIAEARVALKAAKDSIEAIEKYRRGERIRSGIGR